MKTRKYLIPLNLIVCSGRASTKEAGMKGVILTAKHHSGFVYGRLLTELFSKELSMEKWQRDIVRDMSEACKVYRLSLVFTCRRGTGTV